MQRDIVTVEKFFATYQKELKMELVAGETGLSRIIREPTVNRPGLMLAGFTRYFASRRIQVIGNAEAHYLKSLPRAERVARYKKLFEYKIPCIVFCRNLSPDHDFIHAACTARVPVFKTALITMTFINRATLALETLFAPYTLEMGSMVDILGVGVLIRGESGIGKSETVLALIERGYSLVSDDVTRITLTSENELVGTAPEITRNFMEVRGIGIINVPSLFGIRSVRHRKRLDLVVTLKHWDEVPDVERLGLTQQHTRILGLKVPLAVIPVRPGRDIARLIEVAALHHKLLASGDNPAEALDRRVRSEMEKRHSKPDRPETGS